MDIKSSYLCELKKNDEIRFIFLLYSELLVIKSLSYFLLMNLYFYLPYLPTFKYGSHKTDFSFWVDFSCYLLLIKCFTYLRISVQYIYTVSIFSQSYHSQFPYSYMHSNHFSLYQGVTYQTFEILVPFFKFFLTLDFL